MGYNIHSLFQCKNLYFHRQRFLACCSGGILKQRVSTELKIWTIPNYIKVVVGPNVLHRQKNVNLCESALQYCCYTCHEKKIMSSLPV